jgi:hypothetical protein
LANIEDDVDSLHVEIDNLNNLLVGFCFIRSIDYLSSLSNIKEGILPIDVKGKRPIFELQEIQSDSPSPAKGSQWKPPDTNWLCLSVDASYIKETNVAS